MTPRARRWRAPRALLLAALAVWLGLAARALLLWIPGALWERQHAAAGDYTAQWVAFADELRERLPEGDVFLAFEGPWRDPEVAFWIYAACVHELLPHRVYTSDRPGVVNYGADLLRQARTPEPAWLRERDVVAVVELRDAPQGASYRVRRLSDRAP